MIQKIKLTFFFFVNQQVQKLVVAIQQVFKRKKLGSTVNNIQQASREKKLTQQHQNTILGFPSPGTFKKGPLNGQMLLN